MLLAAIARELQQQYDRGRLSRGVAIVASCVIAPLLFVQTYGWAAEWDDSRTVFTASLRTTGPNEPLLLCLGYCFDAIEDFENAGKCFAAAVACDPDSAEAQAQCIRLLLVNRRTDEARVVFERLKERSRTVALRCAKGIRRWCDDGNHAIPNADFMWAYLDEQGLNSR
jgi:tetratricopeptide (TPR) repeat protein